MFGKVFESMFDGTLATKGPWEALVTFQQIIVLADRHGVVDMTAEAISRRTTVPLRIVRKGLAALEQRDPDSRTPDEGGRRIVRLSKNRPWGWQIVNYAKYREIRSQEERREYHRRYWQDNRSPTQKGAGRETQQHSTNSTDAVSRGRSKNHNNHVSAQHGGGELHFPEKLTPQERQGIVNLITQHRLNGSAQLLLDELAGAMFTKKIANPIGYARRIAAAMEAGTFVAEKGHLAVTVRERRVAEVSREREEREAKERATRERQGRDEGRGYDNFKKFATKLKRRRDNA